MKKPDLSAISLGLIAAVLLIAIACKLLKIAYLQMGFETCILVFVGASSLVALLSFCFEVRRVDGSEGLGERLADVDLDIDKNQESIRSLDAEIERMMRG